MPNAFQVSIMRNLLFLSIVWPYIFFCNSLTTIIFAKVLWSCDLHWQTCCHFENLLVKFLPNFVIFWACWTQIITLKDWNQAKLNIIMAMCTCSASPIWLVGGTNEQFQTSKLPSRGDVLKVLFYYHTDKKLSLKDSIDKAASLLLPIWQMARISTKAPNHVVKHICKLHSGRS